MMRTALLAELGTCEEKRPRVAEGDAGLRGHASGIGERVGHQGASTVSLAVKMQELDRGIVLRRWELT